MVTRYRSMHDDEPSANIRDQSFFARRPAPPRPRRANPGRRGQDDESVAVHAHVAAGASVAESGDPDQGRGRKFCLHLQSNAGLGGVSDGARCELISSRFGSFTDKPKDRYADFETEMAIVLREGRSVHLSVFLN